MRSKASETKEFAFVAVCAQGLPDRFGWHIGNGGKAAVAAPDKDLDSGLPIANYVRLGTSQSSKHFRKTGLHICTATVLGPYRESS